jgi:drug/metabolite transporter (DMT)-like permease
MLGEKINLIGIIGMLITIAGIIYISLQKRGDDSTISLIGIGHAIGAALCQGAGLVLAKKAYENNDIHIAPFHAAWLRIVGAVIVLIIFTIITKQIRPLLRNSINPNNRKGLLYLSLGTLSGTVLGLTFAMQTISTIDSAVAQTIFSLVPVMAIPLAYFFHKEKITMAIISGASIAIVGVIILIWRNTILEKLILYFQ